MVDHAALAEKLRTSIDPDRCGACDDRTDRSPLAGGCRCTEPEPVESWPQEIYMGNGPNIIVHSREERDFIFAAARANSGLAAS